MEKSQKKPSIRNKEISSAKKIAFVSILFLVPLILFLLLELGLRAFNYGIDLSLFHESENYPGYYQINKDVNLRYFSKVGRTSPTSDIFLKDKPDSCFRIFVFGESTTRGFPYQAGTSFPRILYYRLQDAFPNKRIEVVNLSASALTSFSYTDMLGEVLEHKPDAILLYGGHNEYYGALGTSTIEGGGRSRAMKKLKLKLIHLKTYQLIRNTMAKSASKKEENALGQQATLMERIVKDKEIILNSAKYQKGIDQYSKNLSEFIEKAKKNKVPVIISELVNNVKDQTPFKSVALNGLPSANDIYLQAKQAEENSNYSEAKQLYYKAKDLDVIRFRSSEEMNVVIHSIAKKLSVTVVPMIEYFEKASSNQLIGNDLMIDHLHPTLPGYFIMADAFFNAIKNNNLIENNWNASRIKPSEYYYNNWGFTELDSLIGDLNIQYLKNGWPYKPKTEINTFLANYRCKDYVDSLAFAYVTSDTMHIENEHIKLANYYSKRKLHNKAFEEYYSLIKLHPYIGDLYHDASKHLIAAQQYDVALQLLQSAPLIEKDFYFYYMLGTLKLKTNLVDSGIKDLEHAYEIIKPEDKPTKVLYPLYAAYKGKNDKVNEERIFTLIKMFVPDFAPAKQEENVSQTDEKQKNIKVIKVSLDEAMDRAEALIRAKKIDQALEILQAVNQAEENIRANKLICAIYMMKNDRIKAYEHSLRAYQIDPNDIDNNNNLYILLLIKGDLNGASKLLDQLKATINDPEKVKRLEALYKKRESELKQGNQGS